jgi:hypothetical protein
MVMARLEYVILSATSAGVVRIDQEESVPPWT